MNNIKQLLKKNKLIFNANAKYKAFKMKKDIVELEKKYSRIINDDIYNLSLNEKKIQELVLNKLKSRIGEIKKRKKGELRIFWVGTNYHQDNSGFLQALSDFGEVICFYNIKGEYGLEKPRTKYDKNVIENNSKCLINQIKNVSNSRKIDILLGQMLANNISVNTLKEIQDMGIITVNIAMDDRLPNLWETYKGITMGSIGLSEGLDLVLNTSPECCVRYLYNGCAAIYWPLASNSKIFKPSKEKDIDVSFIGSKYGIREKIVKAIEKKGIKVSAYGPGWPNGPVSYEESAEIYGRSKIILGIGTIGYTTDIFTLKLRDFDATMSGAFYITHRNPDLTKIFKEGIDVEYYSDENEAAEKVNYYLKNEALREKIAHNGYQKALKHHNWQDRFMKLFNFLQLIY